MIWDWIVPLSLPFLIVGFSLFFDWWMTRRRAREAEIFRSNERRDYYGRRRVDD